MRSSSRSSSWARASSVRPVGAIGVAGTVGVADRAVRRPDTFFIESVSMRKDCHAPGAPGNPQITKITRAPGLLLVAQDERWPDPGGGPAGACGDEVGQQQGRRDGEQY